MLSETISRPTLPNYHQAEPARSSEPLLVPETRAGLRHLFDRAEPWLAFAVVMLGVWASWGASSWLLERWQFQ
jgi:hypothetical protein